MDTNWVTPPFDIVRAAHAELVVTDLARSRAFYVDLLGLVVTEETDDALYLRGFEERLHHSLCLRSGREPCLSHLGFRVRTPDALQRLEEHFGELGCAMTWIDGEVESGQGPGRALRVQDPFGFVVEFFHDMAPAPTLLQRYDLYRGAHIVRLDHFNIYVTDAETAYEHYRTLGFRCSEYIESESGVLCAAWMFRKPTVHDIAFTSGTAPRMHHLGLTVVDAGCIIRTCDQLAGAGADGVIERGPGRHGVSNAFFLYLRDPDGHRIELYTGDYYTGDPDFEPFRWSASDPRRRSFWGSAIPDSWFEEGTSVAQLDGSIAELAPAVVDERLVVAG